MPASTIADPIHGIPLTALYGDAALYLLGHVGFRRYVAGSPNVERRVAVVVLLALIPVMAMMPRRSGWPCSPSCSAR